MIREIIFSGGSHYGVGALRSLQNEFEVIYILKDNDDNIKKLKREKDVIIDSFDSVECPICFLGGHSELITKKQLNKKQYINVHGALLPKYRGMHSTFWAIMNGEKDLGVTYHIVDGDMDHGPILKQFSFSYYGQTIASINKEIDRIIENNTGEVVRDFLEGKIRPNPQDDSKATWGCRRNLNDCMVDFTWGNLYLERLLLALTAPYPLPRIRIKNEIYEILEAKVVERDYFGAVGRCLNIDENGAWIKTSEGFLIIKMLKKVNGGDVFHAKDILRIGYRLN